MQVSYSGKVWWGNFDGYWFFKYLTENILMDGHYLLPNAVLP